MHGSEREDDQCNADLLQLQQVLQAGTLTMSDDERLKMIAKLPPVSNIIEDRVAPFTLPSPERPLAPPLIRVDIDRKNRVGSKMTSAVVRRNRFNRDPVACSQIGRPRLEPALCSRGVPHSGQRSGVARRS